MFERKKPNHETEELSQINRSAEKPPAWAVVVLALALASIFFSLWRGSSRTTVQGPIAIAIAADGSSWLAVDRSVWQIDSQGKRIKEFTGPGKTQRASQLILHPSGSLWAVIQGDDQIYSLQQQSWAPVLRLQWPTDLLKHGTGAQKVAFAPDGHIAVATGGGHFVALFAADGRFIARTAPDTYRYTNGLWFAQQALWTTDTNNGDLVKLELPSMKVSQRLGLQLQASSRRFLGNATPWPSDTGEEHKKSLAAIIAFNNNMVKGHLVAVDSQGGIKAFDGPAEMEPLDAAWHAASRSWWMVDSASFQVRRWSAQGQPLEPAFDNEVRTHLSNSLHERQRIDWQYYIGLALGVTLLICALIGIGWQKYREQRKRAQNIHWKLGTPVLSQIQLIKLSLKTFAFLLPSFALFTCIELIPREARKNLLVQAKMLAPGIFWISLFVLYLFITLGLAIYQTRRISRDPQLEALANAQAVRLMMNNPQALQLAPDETPCEAAWFQHGMRPSLLVITNRGLIFLRLQGMGHLEQYLSVPWRYVTQFDSDNKQKLHIKVENDQKKKEWRGTVPHRALAQRMHDWAQAALRSKYENLFEQKQMELQRSRFEPTMIVPPLRAAIASAMVPGLGQWLQGRKEIALAYFAMAMPTLCFLGFILWIQSVPLTDLEPGLLLTVACVYAAIAIFSAWEASSFSKRKIFDAGMNYQRIK